MVDIPLLQYLSATGIVNNRHVADVIKVMFKSDDIDMDQFLSTDFRWMMLSDSEKEDALNLQPSDGLLIHSERFLSDAVICSHGEFVYLLHNTIYMEDTGGRQIASYTLPFESRGPIARDKNDLIYCNRADEFGSFLVVDIKKDDWTACSGIIVGCEPFTGFPILSYDPVPYEYVVSAGQILYVPDMSEPHDVTTGKRYRCSSSDYYVLRALFGVESINIDELFDEPVSDYIAFHHYFGELEESGGMPFMSRLVKLREELCEDSLVELLEKIIIKFQTISLNQILRACELIDDMNADLFLDDYRCMMSKISRMGKDEVNELINAASEDDPYMITDNSARVIAELSDI